MPPSGSAIALAAALATSAAGWAQEPFRGEIEVTRIVTRVRVVGHAGAPVLGLAPDDFEVTIDGRDAVVEAVEWIPEGRAHPGPAPVRPDATVAAHPPGEPKTAARGRLLVLLFQTDFHRSRLTGLMRMDGRAAELVRGLAAGDRVAVAVFGSHLKLYLDFTEDREAVARALTAPQILAARDAADDGRKPSLAHHLDPRRARRAARLEEALQVLGDALAELPGDKDILLFGWGMGRFNARSGVVRMDATYDRAVAALAAARAAVFSLDITDADRHSLEAGLKRVSAATGGLYYRTNLFPDVAVARLTRVLGGHYELTLVPPEFLGPRFRVEVAVSVPGADVLVSREQVVQPQPGP